MVGNDTLVLKHKMIMNHQNRMASITMVYKLSLLLWVSHGLIAHTVIADKSDRRLRQVALALLEYGLATKGWVAARLLNCFAAGYSPAAPASRRAASAVLNQSEVTIVLDIAGNHQNSAP